MGPCGSERLGNGQCGGIGSVVGSIGDGPGRLRCRGLLRSGRVGRWVRADQLAGAAGGALTLQSASGRGTTVSIVLPASFTSLEPASTVLTESLISDLMSLAAPDERCARVELPMTARSLTTAP